MNRQECCYKSKQQKCLHISLKLKYEWKVETFLNVFSHGSSQRKVEARCVILVFFPSFSRAAREVARLWGTCRRTPNQSFWLHRCSPLAGASGLAAWLQSSVYFLSAVREFHPAPSHWRSWKAGGGEGGGLVSKQFWPHTMKSFLPTRRNSHQENLQLFSPLFFKVGFTDCEEWS